MALKKGTDRTGLIITPIDDLEMYLIVHFFKDNIYNYKQIEDYILVYDDVYTIDQLERNLQLQLDAQMLKAEYERNEI